MTQENEVELVTWVLNPAPCNSVFLQEWFKCTQEYIEAVEALRRGEHGAASKALLKAQCLNARQLQAGFDSIFDNVSLATATQQNSCPKKWSIKRLARNIFSDFTTKGSER